MLRHLRGGAKSRLKTTTYSLNPFTLTSSFCLTLQYKMRALLHKILSLLMVVVFLTSSSGVVLASHICLKGSFKKVSLFENKGCCEKKNKSCKAPAHPSNSFSAKCCVTEYSYLKVDASSTRVTVSAKIFPALDFVTGILSSLSFPFFRNFSAYNSSADLPEADSGKQLLISIHRLLV